MTKKILIDAKYPNEIRAVLVNKYNFIEEIECETADKEQIKGNIYLAKISRIEPSLQAAFITYENGKSGFLPFNEIHPDFFNIPHAAKPVSTEKQLPDNQDQGLQEAITADEPEQKNLDELVDEKAIDKTPIKIDFDTSCDEDEIAEVKVQYENLYKKYRIQDVVKKGQILLVQAQKEKRGNKAASFSTFLSLAGKFCVLMSNTAKQNGISRRIVNQEERKRLKNIINNIVPADGSGSLIIRTAGIDRTQTEIKKDYEYLIKTWDKIRGLAITMTAPSVVHSEEEIIIKTIRDMLDDKVAEVVIQGSQQYEQAIKFIKEILPNEVFKIVEHKNLEPIFSSYGVEDQILNLYQPIVSLPSGGYIVINPTEALTSIDINSGKSINEKHIEETALKTNIEASFEIAKQIKLRDLSGLIVIDFIDMSDNKNRKILEHALKEALSRDKAKIQLGPISNLGLVELSRQRLKPSFLERNSAPCNYCGGKGVVRSAEANAILIMRMIEKELFSSKLHLLNVFAHLDSILYILNKKRKDVERIEREFEVEINFYQDKMAAAESFYLEKIKLQRSTKDATKEHVKEKAIQYNKAKLDNKQSVASNIIAQEVKVQPIKQSSKVATKVNANQVIDESKEPQVTVVDKALEQEMPLDAKPKEPSRNRRRNFTRKKFNAKDQPENVANNLQTDGVNNSKASQNTSDS